MGENQAGSRDGGDGDGGGGGGGGRRKAVVAAMVLLVCKGRQRYQEGCRPARSPGQVSRCAAPPQRWWTGVPGDSSGSVSPPSTTALYDSRQVSSIL